MKVDQIVVALALAVSFVGGVPCVSAQNRPANEVSEPPAFETANIVLYNNTAEFEDRAPDATVMASFIKKVESKAAEIWADADSEKGQSGLIAVAIRPNGTMKFWVDVEEQHQPKLSKQLEEKMRGIGVPPVSDGPVAFALNFHLWGGPSEPAAGLQSIKLPQAWMLAARDAEEKLRVPDGLLPLVWKKPADSSEVQREEMFVPDGFVLEELKPIGGRVLRPQEWTFKPQHRKNALMWTISRENNEDGSYETGMRIQFFAGISKLTGKTAKELMAEFMEGKAKASKVIRTCPEKQQGMFTRTCLLIEKPSSGTEGVDGADGAKPSFRILYSCFWSDKLDMACVSIAGTTPELWETYESTFDTMANFQLLDMDKIRAKK